MYSAHSFYLNNNKKAVWLLVGTFVGLLTLAIIIGIFIFLAIFVISIVDAINMGASVKAYNLKLSEEIRKEINYMKD